MARLVFRYLGIHSSVSTSPVVESSCAAGRFATREPKRHARRSRGVLAARSALENKGAPRSASREAKRCGGERTTRSLNRRRARSRVLREARFACETRVARNRARLVERAETPFADLKRARGRTAPGPHPDGWGGRARSIVLLREDARGAEMRDAQRRCSAARTSCIDTPRATRDAPAAPTSAVARNATTAARMSDDGRALITGIVVSRGLANRERLGLREQHVDVARPLLLPRSTERRPLRFERLAAVTSSVSRSTRSAPAERAAARCATGSPARRRRPERRARRRRRRSSTRVGTVRNRGAWCVGSKLSSVYVRGRLLGLTRPGEEQRVRHGDVGRAGIQEARRGVKRLVFPPRVAPSRESPTRRVRLVSRASTGHCQRGWSRPDSSACLNDRPMRGPGSSPQALAPDDLRRAFGTHARRASFGEVERRVRREGRGSRGAIVARSAHDARAITTSPSKRASPAA